MKLKDKIKNRISKMKKDIKGAISIIGVIITITVVVFIQGYLDTISANYILEEAQSIIDLTALTTLQSSIDTEGLRYERMTIRPYNYDYRANHIDANTTMTDEYKKELQETTIWLDGTNAHYLQSATKQKHISEIMKANFEYYMQNFLLEQLKADGITVENYKLTNFTGRLLYDDWGINRTYDYQNAYYNPDKNWYETKNGPDNSIVTHHGSDFFYMPQATIDATIQLEIDIDSTFTTLGYQTVLKRYNALDESDIAGGDTFVQGTYLIDSGFADNGNLILTVRVLCRNTFY